jgi:hypothetical protein
VHWELKDVLQVKERAQRARAAAVKPAAGVAARGDGGMTWRSAERASAGREAAGGVLRRHVARRKAARGSRSSAHGRRGRRDRAERKTERGGLEVDKGGPGCNFPKVKGLHCKA